MEEEYRDKKYSMFTFSPHHVLYQSMIWFISRKKVVEHVAEYE